MGFGQGLTFVKTFKAPQASSYSHGALFHSDGNIYVGTASKVEVFDSAGTFIREFGPMGESGWADIHGMCELTSGNILFAEYFNNRLREVTTNGDFVRYIPFSSPQAVIALPDGAFMADSHLGNRVVTFNPDGSERSSFSCGGLPTQMILSSSGVIHITYIYGGVVDMYSVSGQYLGTYGQSDAHKLEAPYKIAQLVDGTILVLERRNLFYGPPTNRISMYSETGDYLGQLNASIGDRVADLGAINITASKDGKLLITCNFDFVPNDDNYQPNQEYELFDYSVVDTTSPTSTIAFDPTIEWSVSDVTVTVTSRDASPGSRVKEIRYSINMGAEQIVASSTASFTLTETGSHSISYFAVDNAGNTEATQYATVKIDKIAPITTLSQSAGLITLSATDAHSGVAKIKYQIHGGAVADYSVPFADTVHEVTYWAEDAAGNIEAVKTDIINAGVQSISVSQPRTTGGLGTIGTVTLDRAAGVGGTVINLASSLPGVALVDPTVTVPEGATTASFDIDANPVAIDTSVSITASIYETSQSVLVNVLAPMPSSVTWSVSPVPGGASTTGTISISGPAPTGGTTVTLASSSLSALVGSNVTIPAGAMTATFNVTTSVVSNDTSAVISPTVYGVKLKSTLSILGPKVTSVSLASASITSTTITTGTVTLSTNAPVGGKVVTISSSNASVARVPVSVTVAAGTKTATFTVTAGSVNASSTATITAATNGSTGTVSLTVTPPPAAISGITTNVAAVTGGLAVTGTVTLTSPAPTGGAVIVLASSPTTAGTVSANVTVAAGSTTATFTITTKTVTAATTLSITGSYLGVAKVATITVNPARVVSTLTLNPTTVKGGTNSTGTITLTGIATENVVVSLTSGTTTVATVPASVTVLAGSSIATFSITTLAQTATRTSIITAPRSNADGFAEFCPALLGAEP